MIYPDTSALVAAYVDEASGERVRAWLSERNDELAVSGWLHLEFTSAMAAKARSGAISAAWQAAAVGNFGRQWLGSASTLPIKEKDFARAATMIATSPGLRSGDALHLAIAEAHEATLVTLDPQQAKSGSELGVATMLV